MTALICLLVGAVYMVWGVWDGARIFVLGLIIAVVSLAAGLVHPPHFYLWMAGAGGGALILGGHALAAARAGLCWTTNRRCKPTLNSGPADASKTEGKM